MAANKMGKRKRKGTPEPLAGEIPGCAFGPIFFLKQLRAFIRDRCPDPSEALPSVQVHLAEGEILDVCHIIGLAPRWLALAAIDMERPAASPRMRTEIVPYWHILRITVRPAGPETGHIGFEVDHGAELLTGHDSPEDAFLAMAGVMVRPAAVPTPHRESGGGAKSPKGGPT